MNENARLTRRGLLLTALSLSLVLILMSLPVLQFKTTLLTKRSPNTFVGDEKYTAARAEVEKQAAAYPGASVSEAVTKRTNSKGVETSLVVFTVTREESRTGWQLMTAGLGLPSLAAGLIAVFAALCFVLCLLGCRGSMDRQPALLSGTQKLLRTGAGFSALAALVLVPVLFMALTYTLSRKITLYNGGNEVAGIEGLLTALDAFLYGGTAGENIAAQLSGLEFGTTWAAALLFPALIPALLGAILAAKGQILPALLRGLLYAFVIALSVFILYPFYVMLITAVRSNAETTDMYFLHMLPTTWIWSNITDVFRYGILQNLANSVLLSVGATAIAMLCGIPAAYAMARMPFKGKNIFLGFVIMSQMFSPVVLLVGISSLMNTLHLNDTLIGLMLINAAFNQAFAIWLLYGTFSSISAEMEQAACIDGCGTVGALLHILLPMAAPGIVTTLIFVFINAWNEYTIATVLISTPSLRPITVGITQFSSFNMIEWQYLFAAALLATIPVVILFMCIEKHLAAGLTAGGVKG